jgi:hypothetical protein
VIAGLAGGLAEVAWIILYAQLTGGKAVPVARGVSETLVPWVETASIAVPLGIVIHMSLAILLGIAIGIVLRAQFPQVSGTWFEPVILVTLLVGVWAVNFFVVLPAVNPAFVALVPYGVSLTSKILFGFAAALMLYLFPEQRPASKQV